MYAEANSDISTGDAVEGSAQGQLAYFIPDPGDLLGYEVTAEGPAGPPSAGYSEGERAGSKTAAPSSRGTEGSSLARENALQGTPASPEANAADSAQEEVDGTMPVDGDGDGLQDGASAGSEMEAGRQGPESRGDSLQGIDGQDVQGSGPLGLSSQAAQADAVSQELTQAASLRPQHPAQGTAVNPNQVIEQIVRGVELNVRGENGEIRLQLKPESLGEVEVRIATNNGIVSAAFIAESQRVKSLIEAGLPQLKQQLMEQGLNIQGLSVQVGGGSTYGRDAYPSGSQTASASGIWRQGGSGLVHRTAGSTQVVRIDGEIPSITGCKTYSSSSIEREGEGMNVTTIGASTYSSRAEDSRKHNELGKNDFLRLLTIQLKYQDPMDPVKDHDFIAQLAQFSALEQTENLSQVMERFVASQEKMGIVAQATGLLGKEVVVINSATQETATGIVSSIRFADGVPQLQVNGETYFLWEVQSINTAD